MQLEDYFDFINEDSIRIKGTRVNLEHVLQDYGQGASPEEIVLRYPTLSLEQVHATILYFLANKVKVNAYIDRVRRQQMADYHKWLGSPTGGASAFVAELRKRLDAQRAKLNEQAWDHTHHEAPIPVR